MCSNTHKGSWQGSIKLQIRSVGDDLPRDFGWLSGRLQHACPDLSTASGWRGLLQGCCTSRQQNMIRGPGIGGLFSTAHRVMHPSASCTLFYNIW